ncbi:hypothetical protein GUITHDRAFT_160608 [Guillardia theta CCMP2712]|uniref:Uncharacterized protein n=2 Tax=Guillardia theta TaxID=55529 RepID=L1K3C3_GUITC|nr:hypothetical protein GUITHDRAFT_160608 [Guillardia theta CCMP2712]EKX55092.1 hypothetical protein GUITHDRAFT_160608 [Guillardia theta CCMP2712]|mmetsp:Transcript_4710/g.17106  ORF Transcript_4710/g.17106 Transcript_4710/m.17106 type:complete len:385 (+) Transcript_4710:55-1209(+)|eukprot:XP_005842072.1 hypothetical protein GUITHDRAFT_160608 [Guillardia theta CCMP2712]
MRGFIFRAVACLLLACLQLSTGYKSNSQGNWGDVQPRSSSLSYIDPGQGKPKDDRLLNQAVDAFHQAQHLESELKKSERAVSQQTHELKKELAAAKATAATTGQSKYFRREERLDEDLMRQANRETRRDKRLVAQADREMKSDKKFLEQAYGITDIDHYKAGRGSRSSVCPDLNCHHAKASGLAPAECVVGMGKCPKIQCYHYYKAGKCGNKDICIQPETPSSSCVPDKKKFVRKQWSRKTCPSVSCSQAKALGYTPDFCSVSQMEGPCPQMQCYHYTVMGSCFSANGAASNVCMKPSQADRECVTSMRLSSAARGGGSRRRRHGSGSGWGMYKLMGGTTGLVSILIFITATVGVFFFLFKRYGVSMFLPNRKPVPVPKYYGRL